MTTYTKETALYNTDAIGDDIEGAGETATRYITSVTNDGIMVADASKGASNGSITSNTTGWHIGGVLEFIRNGVSRFWIGLKNQNDTTPTVRIGKAYVANASDNESHMELDYHSLQLIDKEGGTYFHVSDLRGADENTVSITETFTGTGSRSRFLLSAIPSGTVTVKVGSTTYSSTQVETNTNQFRFGGSIVQLSSIDFKSGYIPASGATITATYATSDNPKAFTFGNRGSGNVGMLSYSEGSSNVASALWSHAEGFRSVASGILSHAEGASEAKGVGAHSQGSGTKASSDFQTALGKYNVEDANDTYAVILGNGTSDSARSNAATIDWSGNVGCGAVNYGTCETADATAAKAASVAGYTSSSGGGFNLVAGVVVRVKFTYANSANAPTLDVNGTGAKAIYLNGAVTSSSNPFMWAAGAMVEFMYDGTGWEMVRRLNQKMSLLWANSSPTASAGFSAQTVQAALAGYDFALIHSRFNNNSASSEHWDLAKVGTKSSIGADWGATHASRYATFNTTGVAFEGGSYVTGTSGGSNNIYCIPLEIYGFNF